MSPDNNNEVQVFVVDNAGPGQNSISVFVDLKNKHADDFKNVSVFNGDGITNPSVHASWNNDRTVLVTYSNASIGFQAVKIGNVVVEYERK